MTPIPETYTLVFFALMLFYKMFVEMFICIWISVMCHFSSSVEMQLKKKKTEEEEVLFPGKQLFEKCGPKLQGGASRGFGTERTKLRA